VADPSQSATERQRLPPKERLRALPRNRRGVALAATQSTTTAIRSYRLYLRDATNAFARPYDVELASDDEARELAALMLDEHVHYPCAEVWDRARLVCIVRRDEFGPNTASQGADFASASCVYSSASSSRRAQTRGRVSISASRWNCSACSRYQAARSYFDLFARPWIALTTPGISHRNRITPS
jgi:hypothetical protein